MGMGFWEDSVQEPPDDVLSTFHTLYKVPRVPLGETGSEANGVLSPFSLQTARGPPEYFYGSVY